MDVHRSRTCIPSTHGDEVFVWNPQKGLPFVFAHPITIHFDPTLLPEVFLL